MSNEFGQQRQADKGQGWRLSSGYAAPRMRGEGL